MSFVGIICLSSRAKIILQAETGSAQRNMYYDADCAIRGTHLQHDGSSRAPQC